MMIPSFRSPRELRAPKALALGLGLGLGLVIPGLAGQVRGQAKILPAEPLLALHVDGPATLRATFLPTNLGKMFAGPEFKDMIAPVMQMIEMIKMQAGTDLPIDTDALEKAIYAYSGRLSVAVYMLSDDIDFSAPEPPPFSVVFLLSPDGKTDLVGFCKKCESLADEMGGDKLSDLELEGQTFRIVDNDDAEEPSVALPFMFKEHAVFMIGKDLGKGIARFLNKDQKPTFQPSADLRKSSIGASINATALLKLFEAGLEQEIGDMYETMGSVIVEKLGVRSLDALEVTYGAEGPAVVSQMIVGFNQKDRGLLSAFFPSQRTPNPFIESLPPSAPVATTAYIDLTKLYEGLGATFAELGDAIPFSFEEMEDDFKEDFGFRLKEDFIQKFGPYGIYLQRYPQEGEEPGFDPMAGVNGICFGLEVKDGEAIAQNIDKMLRQQGLHAARKEDEYKGYTVYNLNLMGMLELNYAVTDRLALVGIGDEGAAGLRAVLDQESDIKAGKEPAPPLEAVQNRLKMVSGKHEDQGWSNVAKALASVLGQLDMLPSMLPMDIPPQIDVVIEVLEKLPDLLKTYKSDLQVAVTRTESGRYIHKSIW